MCGLFIYYGLKNQPFSHMQIIIKYLVIVRLTVKIVPFFYVSAMDFFI